MKQSRKILTAFIISTNLLGISCEDSVPPLIDPAARIHIDTVSIESLPIQMDSTRFYLLEAVDFGIPVNVQAADSLAQWLARSGAHPKEMWVPTEWPVCMMPYDTWNHVFVLLEKPYDALDAAGFIHAGGFNRCFWTWRHYTFTRGE